MMVAILNLKLRVSFFWIWRIGSCFLGEFRNRYAVSSLMDMAYWIYVELEYNIEECYHALSDQLDWDNPEGDRCPYDLSKPLPLQES
ncbi:hypothetical protein Tco_0676494 [Tanacetum coccineum]